jgi:uncharacterized protein YjbI with pentapeptide repeats
MANPEHLKAIEQGADAWNEYRASNRVDVPDLSGADLREVDLSYAELDGADLRRAFLAGSMGSAQLMNANLAGAVFASASLVNANLDGANLTGASLMGAEMGDADLTGACLVNVKAAFAQLHGAIMPGADLRGGDFHTANLFKADLREADLSDGDFREANFGQANLNWSTIHRALLSGADFRGAFIRNASLVGSDLSGAILIRTQLEESDITSCRVYGIAAWNVRLWKTTQADLVITSADEDVVVTVDNLEIAQFIYLLMNNEKFRTVIDTITSKVVLILGRFSEERQGVIQAIRSEVRKRNYLPVVFDFDKPRTRDLTETVSTLAHLSRFIIADITDPRSVPQELMRIIPQLPSVPVQPLLLANTETWAMFESLRRFPWVLEPHVYDDVPTLLKRIDNKVISPAESKVRELTGRS